MKSKILFFLFLSRNTEKITKVMNLMRSLNRYKPCRKSGGCHTSVFSESLSSIVCRFTEKANIFAIQGFISIYGGK